MDVRIVFSDLDGTLLTTDKRLSPATEGMLALLAERGIPFVPASGRALTGLPQDLLEMACCRYAVCSNGAAICRVSDGAVLHSSLMGVARARALWERVRGLDVTFDIFADGKVWAERRAFERMDSFGIEEHTLRAVKGFRTVTERTPDQTLDMIEATGGSLERVTLFWHTPEDRDAAIAAVDADPTLAWTNSVPHDIEVLDAGASKGAALRWLCGDLGLPAASSVAFGDGLNDVSMLQAAGKGIAMENAEPEALEAADMVTLGNDADGVAVALRSLLEG